MNTKTPPSGISLCVNKAPHPECKHQIHKNKYLYLDLDWVNLTFSNHSNFDNHYLHSKKIHLILDGNIISENKSLHTIIDEFLEQGSSSIAKLKGSFALCFINTSENSIHFFTDKRNSRSYFLSETKNEIRIATRVDFLAHNALKNSTLEINKQAVTQYLIRGAFYSNHTLFKTITKIQNATELTIKNGASSKRQYWSLQFNNQPLKKYNEHDLIEQGHELIKTSLEKSIDSFSSPLLFLSGGTDSRVILGLLGDINHIKKTHAITWGMHPIQTGDDLSIAIELAKQISINHQVYDIESNNFQNYIHKAVQSVDCRVDILDAPALTPLWKSLGNDYDCFINGDEWFGWHGKVQNSDKALEAVGWWGLDKASRINDWIYPEEKNKLKNSLEQTLQEIISKPQTNDPNDQKDAIYFYERIGNILNGQLTSKLPFMSPIQPLLDDDVVEFVSQLPQKYRYDKHLLRLILQHKYPELDQLPYAAIKALPTPTRLQSTAYQNQALLSFLQQELFNNKNELLANIIDFEKVESVYHAFYSGSPLPSIENSLLDNIPMLWRFLPKPENRVPPITGVFRMLALNIYLNQIIEG